MTTSAAAAAKLQVEVDTCRPFKVVHQSITVDRVDMDEQRLCGSTELSLLPLTSGLRSIKLQCSQQCSVSAVSFSQTAAAAAFDDDGGSFSHEKYWPRMDATDLAQLSTKVLKSLFHQIASKMDVDLGQGELTVRFPTGLWPALDQLKLIRVRLHFTVDKPETGLRFLCPGGGGGGGTTTAASDGEDQGDDGQSIQERACHVYTWKSSNYESRAWFPCVDCPRELCLWNLEVTCDACCVAVCSGELLVVRVSKDGKSKTFEFQVSSPTPACNVGFAIGPFDLYVHTEMNELANFCLPGLLPLLRHTCQMLHKIFEFFEELLSFRYPHSSYKQVFVYDLPEPCVSYATLSLFDVSTLYHQKVLEQPPLTRALMATAVARQFFGCFVVSFNFQQRWLTMGIARYIGMLYQQRFFGNNEFIYQMEAILRDVVRYEETQTDLVLLMAADQQPADAQSVSPLLCPPRHGEMLLNRATLLFRMLEKKLGKDLFLQVLNKLLSITSFATQQRLQPAQWTSMLLSCESFCRCVSNVSGQDLDTFLEQWVRQGGHAVFHIEYSFNRKRNMIELEVKQDPTCKGVVKYLGPLSVHVQELDGLFAHTVQLDDLSSKHDIQCHSKARRQRKRKIPLWTGEEVDIDLSSMDTDCPVLWVLVDPDICTVRSVNMKQPDYNWQYQLKHERNVVAQLDAVRAIVHFPSLQSHLVLWDTIENDQCFYRIRCEACFALTSVANRLPAGLVNQQAQLVIFRKLFGCKSCPALPSPNDFSNLERYFVKKALVLSVAQARSQHSGDCPQEVLTFLYDLLKYNHSEINRYSDDYYRAALLEAFGKAVARRSVFMPADASRYAQKSMVGTSSRPIIHKMFRRVLIALLMDSVQPSYNRVITCACLTTIAMFTISRVVEVDHEFWLAYLDRRLYGVIRRAATTAVIDIAKEMRDRELFMKLVTRMRDRNDPMLRRFLVEQLVRSPPFLSKDRVANRLHCKELFEALCQCFCEFGSTPDFSFHTALLELISILFGTDPPLFLNFAPASCSATSPAQTASEETL